MYIRRCIDVNMYIHIYTFYLYLIKCLYQPNVYILVLEHRISESTKSSGYILLTSEIQDLYIFTSPAIDLYKYHSYLADPLAPNFFSSSLRLRSMLQLPSKILSQLCLMPQNRPWNIAKPATTMPA